MEFFYSVAFYDFFHLALSVFKSHPCCNMYLYVIPFYGHGMDTPLLFIHSSAEGHLDHFHFLAIITHYLPSSFSIPGTGLGVLQLPIR